MQWMLMSNINFSKMRVEIRQYLLILKFYYLPIYKNLSSIASENTDTTSAEQTSEPKTENKKSNINGEEETSKSSEYSNVEKVLDILRGDITIKLLSEFLVRKNRSDMQILKITKVNTEMKR